MILLLPINWAQQSLHTPPITSDYRITPTPATVDSALRRRSPVRFLFHSVCPSRLRKPVRAHRLDFRFRLVLGCYKVFISYEPIVANVSLSREDSNSSRLFLELQCRSATRSSAYLQLITAIRAEIFKNMNEN